MTIARTENSDRVFKCLRRDHDLAIMLQQPLVISVARAAEAIQFALSDDYVLDPAERKAAEEAMSLNLAEGAKVQPGVYELFGKYGIEVREPTAVPAHELIDEAATLAALAESNRTPERSAGRDESYFRHNDVMAVKALFKLIPQVFQAQAILAISKASPHLSAYLSGTNTTQIWR